MGYGQKIRRTSNSCFRWAVALLDWLHTWAASGGGVAASGAAAGAFEWAEEGEESGVAGEREAAALALYSGNEQPCSSVVRTAATPHAFSGAQAKETFQFFSFGRQRAWKV